MTCGGNCILRIISCALTTKKWKHLSTRPSFIPSVPGNKFEQLPTPPLTPFPSTLRLLRQSAPTSSLERQLWNSESPSRTFQSSLCGHTGQSHISCASVFFLSASTLFPPWPWKASCNSHLQEEVDPPKVAQNTNVRLVLLCPIHLEISCCGKTPPTRVESWRSSISGNKVTQVHTQLDPLVTVAVDVRAKNRHLHVWWSWHAVQNTTISGLLSALERIFVTQRNRRKLVITVFVIIFFSRRHPLTDTQTENCFRLSITDLVLRVFLVSASADVRTKGLCWVRSRFTKIIEDGDASSDDGFFLHRNRTCFPQEWYFHLSVTSVGSFIDYRWLPSSIRCLRILPLRIRLYRLTRCCVFQ